jgi:elongation factor 2
MEDISFHSDAMHRSGNQFLPAVRRVMMSSMLSAEPRLMEPVYLVDIQCADDVLGVGK